MGLGLRAGLARKSLEVGTQACGKCHMAAMSIDNWHPSWDAPTAQGLLTVPRYGLGLFIPFYFDVSSP